jgi:hypothetical protein
MPAPAPEPLPQPAPVYEQFEQPLQAPPSAPRSVPSGLLGRIFFTNGAAITAMVFAILGTVYTILGICLSIGLISSIVGMIFLILGIVFLAVGLGLGYWRIKRARTMIELLRNGTPALGQVLSVEGNPYVRVNGQTPFTIAYQFNVIGQIFNGSVTTLNYPALLQPGQAVYALYQPDNPQVNTLYPALF